MSRGFNGAIMRAFGARDHVATVTGVADLTPHCKRISFHSDTLFDEADDFPTAFVRGWFPDGKGKEFQRAYTFSSAHAQTGDFTMDFVLHAPSGPASAWAVDVAPGDELSVMWMSAVPFEVPPENPPSGYLLIGDSASLPALNSVIATIPADIPIELYFEQHDPHDRDLPMTTHPRLQVHWVQRADTTTLATALENRDWSDWYMWAGPETGTLKEVRKRTKEFGFPKAETYTHGYWVEGKAMGKERDPHAELGGLGESAAAATVAETVEPEIAAPAAAPVVQGTWRAAGAGRLLAPLKGTLILAGVLQAIVTLLQLAPYVLLVELGRRILNNESTDRLWSVGIWALILLGAGLLLQSALTVWLHTVDARFSRDLRREMLAKLARLPLGWFTGRSSGNVKTLVADNTASLHYLVTHAVMDAVAAVVAPIAVLVYLFICDWRIALFLFIPVVFYIVTMWRMMAQSGSKIPQAQSWADHLNSEAAAYLDAQPVIRTFGGAMASRFRRTLDDYIDFLRGWQGPFIKAKTLMDLVTRPTTFLWLIVAVGTWFVVTDRIDAVDLLPFLFLGTTFGARLLGIGYGIGGIRTGTIAARDIQDVLEEPELVVAPDREHPGPAPDVEFRNVTFGYRRDNPVVRDVSLHLVPGTVTALVGPSGSGKSTLASLLARFYDVDSGSITIGGADLRSMPTDELYKHLGFVLQQSQLVNGTVAENIALAVPDASRSQIEEAARAANIAERIEQMPQGYDTPLGPDAALSGGELQRLTIARAILADAPILVLDEATAFADPESEYLVQQSLSRLAAGRTVLVIAHRLNTITDVDAIVVLDDGQIVETGTHAELLAAGGRYRALWDSAHSDSDESTPTTGALR